MLLYLKSLAFPRYQDYVSGRFRIIKNLFRSTTNSIDIELIYSPLSQTESNRYRGNTKHQNRSGLVCVGGVAKDKCWPGNTVLTPKELLENEAYLPNKLSPVTTLSLERWRWNGGGGIDEEIRAQDEEGAIAQLVVHRVVAARSLIQNCYVSVQTLFCIPSNGIKLQSSGGHYS